MALLAVIIIVLIFVVTGSAIAYVVGAGAVLTLIEMDEARYLAALPQRIFSQLDVFAFMAMPLFILVGEIMNRGGITRALINFAMVLVGRLKGGLGHVNIMTSVFFAGISGSAAADAAALSTTLVPAMQEKGYDPLYAGAVTAASAIIGPLIPPSVILVFYGSIMGVDVSALFVAGVIPGLLLAAALMVTNGVLAHRHDHPRGDPKERPAFSRAFLSAAPALLLPAIILGGITFGITTPTEAAGVAVLVALIVTWYYGTLSLRDVKESLKRTVTLTGSIFVILAAAATVSYLASLVHVPQYIASVVSDLGLTGTRYLLLIAVIFIIIGMFLDLPIALALFPPLLVPVAIAQGADPIHVGLAVCLTLAIGLITPPLGGILLIVASVTGCSYWALARATLPFVVTEICLLLLIVLVPDITLYLPRLLGLH